MMNDLGRIMNESLTKESKKLIIDNPLNLPVSKFGGLMLSALVILPFRNPNDHPVLAE